MTRVVVAGGGIAGLSLAFALGRQLPGPDEVLVLEGGPRPGGNIRTDSIDGYLCEWGPNGFLDNVPETFALVSAVGLHHRLVRSSDSARRRFIYRTGRLHEVPAGPGAFLTSGLLSRRGKLRIACEPFAAGPPDGDETIYGFAARRIGREAADALVDPMVSGVFAGNARELSLRACFPKMADMEAQYGGLFRALIAKIRERRRGVSHHGTQQPMGAPTGALTSFVGGTQDLIDALARQLGPALRLETSVTGVAPTAGGWQVQTSRGENLETSVLALATPAGVSADLLGSVDPALARTLRAIRSAPLAVVCAGYPEADVTRTRGPLDGFGFLVPRGEGLRILGALWDSSIYPGRAPGGRVLIRAIMGGAHDPSVLALSDDELLETVKSDLRRAMNLAIEPSFVRIFRHPLGIPQYTVGHLDRLAEIDSRLAAWPGLFLAGNAYRGPSINACIADADRLAASALAHLEGLP